MLLLLPCKALKAQNFEIILDTLHCANGIIPHTYHTDQVMHAVDMAHTAYFTMDRESVTHFKPMEKSFSLKLQLLKPTVVPIANSLVVCSPGKTLRGYFMDDGNEIVLSDSFNINQLFFALGKNFTQKRVQWISQADKSEFMRGYTQLKKFLEESYAIYFSKDSIHKYQADYAEIAAIKQYFNIQLGNCLFYALWKLHLPLTPAIEEQIAAIFPANTASLMELREGKSLLQSSFFYQYLHRYGYRLFDLLQNNNYANTVKVKKYLGYRYFMRLVDDSARKSRISDEQFYSDFKKFKQLFTYSKEEQKALTQLDLRFAVYRNSFAYLLSNEKLYNLQLAPLPANKIKHLGMGNKLLYFWASWCIPCRSFLATLKSSTVKYNNDSYEMIFISIDADAKKWQAAQYPFFTNQNSFLIKDLSQSMLNKAFHIENAVPRIIEIKHDKIGNTSVDKSMLHE